MINNAIGLLLTAGAAPVDEEFIFTSAPFESCHASTIAETSEGLVAAWFGGTREGQPDVGIWLARREERGWSRPQEVATGTDLGPPGACFNPVLHQLPAGPLLLFYKVGDDPELWRGALRRSSDQGRSWTAPEALEGIVGPVKNKPVRLPDGTLLSGSSSEHRGWAIHFERSCDGGSTWERIEVPVSPGIEAIQPSILQHPGGRLQAIGRTRQSRLFSTWSDDGGSSWTPLELLDVPNPNSGTDALTLSDGRHLLVYNPTVVPDGRWGGDRTPLSVALSEDGRHWRRLLDLEREPGEYSYPAVIQRADGLVSVTYTWRRERIRHVVLDPRALEGNGQPADLAFHVKQTTAAGVPPQEE